LREVGPRIPCIPGDVSMTYITQQNAVSDLISESEFYRIPHRKDSKEDVIAINLKKFAIALEIMAGHPEVMNEFKTALGAASTQHQRRHVSNSKPTI
jgi:hypothetical protein